MKRKLRIFVATVLALSMILSAGVMASAASTGAGPVVRVNGYTVEFPDGQPYFDENNRTMIPVRFVTEELGAIVSWDQASQCAVIQKDDICIEIPIGSATFKVTENGETRTVTMDTTAVAKGGRTYVPIRFVAESLGAYVDYSDAYRTVGIYLDELTSDEIDTLRSYDYTLPEGATTYDEYKSDHSQEKLDFYFGTVRNTFGNYANAHEYLYSGREVVAGFRTFPTLGLSLTNPSSEEFYNAVIRETKAVVDYSSERMTITFRTDSSCIYHADNMNYLSACVRGIAFVKLNVKPTELTGAETARLCCLGFTQLYQDVEMSIPVDIHMNTTSSAPVNIHTYVPLADAQ